MDLSRFSQHGAMSSDDGTSTTALVKWFNLSKGFGFVAPTDGSPDAFLHISVLNRAGLQELSDGTAVTCQIIQGPKGPQVTEIIEVTGAATGRPAATIDTPPSDAPGGPALEVSGTVKWFKPDKGFGFITADDTSQDVFIHKSVLRHCGLPQIETGQRVRMKVQAASKGREATWIIPL